MRNFKLFLLSAVVISVSLFIYSCSKEKELSKIDKDDSSINTSVSNRNNITYPINDFRVWRLPTSVYTVIYPINATGQTDVWIIQSNVVNSIESVITVSSANLGFYSTYLRLHNESTDLAYLLFGKQHPVYRANTAGLIRIVDTNLLLDLRSMTPSTKDEVIDDVNEKATCKKEGSSDKECKCAGGTGATSCECSGSIAGFSYHEQVSCGEKMFACCPGL